MKKKGKGKIQAVHLSEQIPKADIMAWARKSLSSSIEVD
jgi:hypothetical protein